MLPHLSVFLVSNSLLQQERLPILLLGLESQKHLGEGGGEGGGEVESIGINPSLRV